MNENRILDAREIIKLSELPIKFMKLLQRKKKLYWQVFQEMGLFLQKK